MNLPFSKEDVDKAVEDEVIAWVNRFKDENLTKPDLERITSEDPNEDKVNAAYRLLDEMAAFKN